MLNNSHRWLALRLASRGSTLALAASLVLSGTGNAEPVDDFAALCRTPAPIYRHVPYIGARLGDLSEHEFSYCQPIDDEVAMLSPWPRYDNFGEAWTPVVVTGRYAGKRTGWVLQRHLAPARLAPRDRDTANRRDDG